MTNFPVDPFLNTGLEDELTIVSSSSIIKGHFHNAYDTIGLQVEIEGRAPWFECATADITALSRNDAVIVNGTTYKVKDKQPNGTGMSVIFLYEI